jgi:hypothetical protein
MERNNKIKKNKICIKRNAKSYFYLDFLALYVIGYEFCIGHRSYLGKNIQEIKVFDIFIQIIEKKNNQYIKIFILKNKIFTRNNRIMKNNIKKKYIS